MGIYTELLKQYNAATGENCKTIYDKGFKEWLETYSQDISKYIDFLEANKVYLKESDIAEIDKGPFDSLLIRSAVDDLNRRLITESATPINVPKRKLKVRKKELVVLYNGQYLPLEDFEAYMSYNLLTANQVDRFSVLHNQGNHIIYGVFGKIYDQDKRSKLENVQRIYKGIYDGEFKLNYVEMNDTYFYYIESNDYVAKRKTVR